MEKRLMIITSEYTGHGHKSITEALSEQFNLHEEINLDIVDGYRLSGSFGLQVGKLYGSITRTSKDLWKIVWDISMRHPEVLVDLIEHSIKDTFLQQLEKKRPDAIVSTHPNYVSSILNILDKHKFDIPFFTMLADPVTITPLWCDKRAVYTICPSEESKAACLGFGIPNEKLKVSGFPVRERFCRVASVRGISSSSGEPLKCLIMSGGEGSGNMSRIAKILLENFNCDVSIICGRNKVLKKRLELTLLEKYGERVHIMGFVNDIQNLMVDSDLLFARASPNVMMEAVMCGLPVIVTGALPGQEQGNPYFIEKYNLGVVCMEIKKVKNTVSGLLENGEDGLKKIKRSQADFRDPDISKKIVDFILENI